MQQKQQQQQQSFETTTMEPKTFNSNREESQGIVASSDFIVQFPPNCIPKVHSTSGSTTRTTGVDDNFVVLLQINGNHLHESFLSMKLPSQQNTGKNSLPNSSFCTFQQGRSTKPSTDVLKKLVDMSLLTPGRNLIRYILVQKHDLVMKQPENDELCSASPSFVNQQYTTIGQVEAYVFLWSVHDSIIISDIDGTLTKSDVRGVIDSIFMERYLDGVGHVHEGVCSLFHDLVKCPQEQHNHNDNKRNKMKSDYLHNDHGNDGLGGVSGIGRMGQVRILYLSSRPIQLIHATRKFLSLLSQKRDWKQPTHNTLFPLGGISDKVTCCRNVANTTTTTATTTSDCTSQNVWIPVDDGHASLVSLPPGPIFLHRGTLSTVLLAELVTKSMHEFKADLLTRQVVLPFVAAGKKALRSPLFLAGFGNKKTDSLAYEMAGMNCHDIYIIDKKSVLVRIDNPNDIESDTDVDTDTDTDTDKKRNVNTYTVGEQLYDGCCAWEPIVTNICPLDNLSSKKISVSNPKKLSSFSPPSSATATAVNKRHFRGYNDPQLRKELFRRISSC
jgi:phosphatidate phosphatase LPIN